MFGDVFRHQTGKGAVDAASRYTYINVELFAFKKIFIGRDRVRCNEKGAAVTAEVIIVFFMKYPPYGY